MYPNVLQSHQNHNFSVWNLKKRCICILFPKAIKSKVDISSIKILKNIICILHSGENLFGNPKSFRLGIIFDVILMKLVFVCHLKMRVLFCRLAYPVQYPSTHYWHAIHSLPNEIIIWRPVNVTSFQKCTPEIKLTKNDCGKAWVRVRRK